MDKTITLTKPQLTALLRLTHNLNRNDVIDINTRHGVLIDFDDLKSAATELWRCLLQE
jgi:hypothetical protein